MKPTRCLHLAPLMLAALLAGTHAIADDRALSGELPTTAIVRQVLLGQASVRAAERRRDVASAESERLQAGAHEWTLRLAGQQRRSQPANGLHERFNEWNVAIERPIRLPGKSGLDQQLGQAAEQLAETAQGDALHEASRALLQAWFTWLRENTAEKQWTAQVALLDHQHRALARRQQLGDAALIERVQSAAALAQAQAELAQVRGRRLIAGEMLQLRYPGLPLALPDQLAEPLPPAGNPSAWTTAILEHSHELGIARQLARRARLQASRQNSERLPDPSFGLHYANERAGEENIIGAYVSLPLPGAGRGAIARGALAEAEASSQDEAAIQQKISGEALSLYRNALSAVDAWHAGKNAAEQLKQAAGMSTRAWQLGEGSLSEVLLARRLAHEAELTALTRQLDALEAGKRLLLDAHRLWDIDNPEATPANMDPNSHPNAH